MRRSDDGLHIGWN